MISEAAFALQPQTEVTSGAGWSILSAADLAAQNGMQVDNEAASSTSQLTPPASIEEIDPSTNLEGSPLGKKRKRDDASMTDLRDRTFSDSTHLNPSSSSNADSSAKMDRFQAIRTTADVPAEGAGLRGNDAPLGGFDNEGKGLTSPLLAGAPTKKLCIRHQRMADEGTTAKLQRVSDIIWREGRGGCNLSGPFCRVYVSP
jgi:hypothetical protein